jgi:glycerol-3-phosphate acyltransferase PlsX
VVTVALDAMGGDRGPAATVAGALEAAREGIAVMLCGRPEKIERVLRARGGAPPDVTVVEAPDVVDPAAEPVAAVRALPDSSLVAACRLVRDGRAAAAVSAGPTGATLAAALLQLRRLPGVTRPAIAAVLPARAGPCILIDAGANVDARPEQLVQFGVMGAVFAEKVLGIPRPTVALLSNGEEPSTGTRNVVEAHRRLAASGLAFVGNREGRDALTGQVTVLVADGFAGNVLLKGMEGAADVLFAELRDAARTGLRAKAGALLLRPAFRAVNRRLHPDTYGGAHLLGLRGIVVVAHGNAGPDAVANAVRYAARGAAGSVVERMAERLSGARPSGLHAGAGENTVPPVSSPVRKTGAA